jgi:hypothetical protein
MVKTLLVSAALVASASAFAPAKDAGVSTSLNAFANGYVGGDNVEPMFIGKEGSKNFDPCGFTEVSEHHVDRLLPSHFPTAS